MIDAPNDKWLPFLKVAFGFMELLVLAGLGLAIALGHVEQNTSFGLSFRDILGALSTLAGAFAQWAFTEVTKGDTKDG